LSGLKPLAPEVAVFEHDDLLQSLLSASDIKVQPASSSFSGKLSLIRLGAGEEEMDWLDKKLSMGQPTIYIVSSGVTSFEQLLPIKFVSNGHAAIVQDWFVPDLKASPLSQLRLLHTTELLLKPEAVKAPGTPKPKK
jgi:hypothetical protein